MFRFGIIGAANVAHRFVQSVRRIPDAAVVAVASKSKERAARFAAEEQIPAAYDSYEEMLKQEPLDAVYIATTVNFHYENTMLALRYRVPVLCEKALTDSAAHAREMFRYAAEQKTFLMEALWTLFTEKTEKVRAWIADGRIGEVNLIQGHIGFTAAKDPENRYYSPALGGGVMLDLGPYLTAVPAYMAGQKIVSYRGRTQRGFTGVDEKVVMDLQLEKAVCEMIGSFETVLPETGLIAGTKGYISMPAFHNGRSAFLYDEKRQLAEEFYERDTAGFEGEIEELIRCVKEGRLESSVSSPALSIQCAEIFDYFRGL